MKCIPIIPMVFAVCAGVSALAEPLSRDSLTIHSIHPMSKDRLHCPTCSGVTRIYVNEGAWGSSNCRADAADLLIDDEHILSILLTAFAMGKTVRIEVDNQAKPIDQVCKITAAWIYK